MDTPSDRQQAIVIAVVIAFTTMSIMTDIVYVRHRILFQWRATTAVCRPVVSLSRGTLVTASIAGVLLTVLGTSVPAGVQHRASSSRKSIEM